MNERMDRIRQLDEVIQILRSRRKIEGGTRSVLAAYAEEVRNFLNGERRAIDRFFTPTDDD